MTLTMPVVSTLVALEQALKFTELPEWVGVTPEQCRFRDLALDYDFSLGVYDQWVKACAARTAAEINRFLAENGFDVRLNPWPDNGRHFGVAGVTDVLVNWVLPGVATQIRAGGESFPAFTLDLHSAVAGIMTDPDGQVVIELQTLEGLVVRFQVRDEPGSSLDVVEASLKLHQAELKRPVAGELTTFQKVCIPMVMLDNPADLGWLRGLLIPGNPVDWELIEIVGQTKFAMNWQGAHIKETAAGRVSLRGLAPRVYTLDEEFFMTVGHPDARAPIFGAQVPRRFWKDPGDIEVL